MAAFSIGTSRSNVKGGPSLMRIFGEENDKWRDKPLHKAPIESMRAMTSRASQSIREFSATEPTGASIRKQRSSFPMTDQCHCVPWHRTNSAFATPSSEQALLIAW